MACAGQPAGAVANADPPHALQHQCRRAALRSLLRPQQARHLARQAGGAPQQHPCRKQVPWGMLWLPQTWRMSTHQHAHVWLWGGALLLPHRCRAAASHCISFGVAFKSQIWRRTSTWTWTCWRPPTRTCAPESSGPAAGLPRSARAARRARPPSTSPPDLARSAGSACATRRAAPPSTSAPEVGMQTRKAVGMQNTNDEHQELSNNRRVVQKMVCKRLCCVHVRPLYKLSRGHGVAV